MNPLDSTDISLVFPPEEQVRNVAVTVVEGLVYGLIVGAPFLRQNGSVINLADGGSFRLTPGSPWVSFVVAEKHQTGEGGGGDTKVTGSTSEEKRQIWRTAEIPDKEVTSGGRFYVAKPASTEQEPPDTATPLTVPGLGEAAWEDDGTLTWKTYSGKHVKVDGFVSVQTEAFVGPGGQYPCGTRTCERKGRHRLRLEDVRMR